MTIISPLPDNLTNGTTADASQVMANFNQIVSNVNANAAGAGANSTITSLTGLTTPLTQAQGGTGVYTFGTTTGTANAQVMATGVPANFSLAIGKIATFVAGNSNTGATTLNLNGTGATAIKKLIPSGVAALAGGEIVSGGTYQVIYDGTEYILMNPSVNYNAVLTAALAGDVALNDTSNYFGGPFVAQGTEGIWLVGGSVTVQDTAGSANFAVKLWDGTTVIASGFFNTPAIFVITQATLFGVIANPASNLIISVKDTSSTSGKILYNVSGNAADSSITAVRIG